MNPVYKKLFDTYGDTMFREQDSYDATEINAYLDELHLDKDTKRKLNDLFFEYNYRWSIDAFTLGLHLGLSLLDSNIRCVRPQEVQ